MNYLNYGAVNRIQSVKNRTVIGSSQADIMI